MADGKADMAEALTVRPMRLTPVADNVGTRQRAVEAGEKKGSDQRATVLEDVQSLSRDVAGTT